MTHGKNIRTSESTFTSSPLSTGLLQRKCACGQYMVAGGECEECAKKKNGLQRKLTIGASNDPLELEADRVAEQVLATSANPAISGKTPSIQRYTGQATEGTNTAPASVERVLASSGSPIDPALRQDMEQRFGHDFSQVRVHTGSCAEQSARDVIANAYTVGNNVVFGAGQFAPETYKGRRLIAHELTHVVQQNGSSLNSKYQNDHVRDEIPLVGRSLHSILQRGSDRCSGSGATCSEGDLCAKPDNVIADKDVSQSSAWSLTVNVDIERDSWENALYNKEFGHTHVRFWESSGKQFTYGFYPEKDLPNESRRVVPGCVHHPDTTHDACIDDKVSYSLTQPQYGDALEFAQKVCRDKHEYGPNYTCTTYAGDIAKAAGQSLPSTRSTPTTIFYQNVPAIDNPNTVHENIQEEIKKDPKKKGFWNTVNPPTFRLRQVNPINLNGDPESTVFEHAWMPPVASGATFRWRLFDANSNHYLMRGAEGNKEILDWLSFTTNQKAIIGRNTRDLLKQRSATQGSVHCTVRLSVWPDQVVTVPVAFVF